jgi:hypothetical protein
MAFDKHTQKLANYYRSVGQSPAEARRLAKQNSASYIPGRRMYVRKPPSAANALLTKIAAHNTRMSAILVHSRGFEYAAMSAHAAGTAHGRTVGSFKHRKGQWKKGKGGRFVGTNG